MFVMLDGGAMIDGGVPFVFVLSVLPQMCEGDLGGKLGVGGKMWKQAHVAHPIRKIDCLSHRLNSPGCLYQ